METKSELVHKLQQDIMMWQGFKPAAAGKAERIGLGAIEDAFPGGVFPKGAIHEFITVFPEDAASAWNNLLEEKSGRYFASVL
ncbi:hypothetical protein [Pedobacter sp. KBS0701]|uniref:hypothetical protein n=1 Tax=unclassified Pedobacter TaxID=2628915 RepID=UPI00110EF321|nr:hypothetical protein [Pedobacter sp. KBS0701]QDW25281.1 hypothetical protein FFJ24_010860 [Pedobacter sp. KBS0701]